MKRYYKKAHPKSSIPPTLKQLKKNFLKDEIEWIDEETKFIDKALPFFSKKILPKLIILVIFLIFLARFFKIFTTVAFIFFVSYIRFKRVKLGIFMEIEPTYLLGIVLCLAFGLPYGYIYILIPGLIMGITDGFEGALLINVINKFIVFSLVYLFWIYLHNTTYIIWFATLMVVITDIISFTLRKRMGQPIHQIIQALGLNSLLRLMYFSLFLQLLVSIL